LGEIFDRNAITRPIKLKRKIKPNAVETIYLKFPIEIGVFAKDGGKVTVVDVFTFDKPKYTLYGNPKSDVVCRWFWTAML